MRKAFAALHGRATRSPLGAPFGLDPRAVKEITLDAPKTFHVAGWGRMNDRQRVAMLRQIAESSGRDPRIRQLAFGILQGAGLAQRDYQGQAAAILRWVQANVNYVNEPGEILQDPLYTVKVKSGDCDDIAMLIAALFEAVALPWKYVLSGVVGNQRVQWIEGARMDPSITWSHIYNAVELNKRWVIAEGTMKGAPLGHDVAMTGQAMPEMRAGSLAGYGGAGSYGFPVTVVDPTEAGSRAAWYAVLKDMDVKAMAAAVIVGVLTSVIGQIALDAVKDYRKGKL